MRLDKFLAESDRGISREQAKGIITSGGVTVNGKVISKPAFEVSGDEDILVSAKLCPYVSRGGYKLEGALKEFSIDLKGKVCADIGASTGGFTDCMLQNGARLVYAIDVGHGQLDEKLINDSRVINREGVNVRYLTADIFEEKPQFISADLSFISLKLVLGGLVDALDEDGEMVLLIKPQFEVGKANIGKNGIVKDKKVHIRLLDDMLAFFAALSLTVSGVTVSSITGGDGNIEYLAYLKKLSAPKPFAIDTKELVNQAFSTHKK